MLKLVKEVAGLCYSLDKLYYREKNVGRKKELEKNFIILSKLLERAIKSQFEENDMFYKKEVKKLRKISADIKKAGKGLYKYEKLISNLSKISENLDHILSRK